MIWVRFIFWPVLLVTCAIVLFQVKHNARKVEARSAAISREINKTEASIKVLEAEWSTLNQPAYLAALAGHYMGYSSENRTRIVNISDLPMRENASARSRSDKERLDKTVGFSALNDLDDQGLKIDIALRPKTKPVVPDYFKPDGRDGLRSMFEEDALTNLISEIGADQ